jgi:hypothetical protein
LVPIESARPEVLAIIEREGEVILGQSQPTRTRSPRTA